MLRLSILLAFYLSVETQAATPIKDRPITSIAEFKAYLEQHPEIRKIQEILPKLDPNMFKGAEALYVSKSLQGASLDNPRIIASRQDNLFTVTFNGDPSQEGYDTLELMEWLPSPDSRFILHSHRFAGDTEDMKRVQGPHYRQPEKTNCLSCHRADPRPNWFEYNVEAGSLALKDVSPRIDQAREAFMKRAASHARYKFIPGGKVGGSFDPNEFNQNRIVRLLQERLQPKDFVYAIVASLAGCKEIESFIPEKFKGAVHPFDTVFADQRERGSRQVVLKLDIVKPDITYALGRRPDRGSHPSAMINNLLNGNSPLESNPKLFEDYRTWAEKYSAESNVWKSTAGLRYVAQFLNLNTEDFSTVFEEGSYGLRVSGFDNAAPDRTDPYTLRDYTLAYKIAAAFGILDTAGPKQTDGERPVNCAGLKKTSLARLEKIDPKSLPSRKADLLDENAMAASTSCESLQRSYNNVINQKCLSCHQADDAQGPFIPFMEPQKMRSYVNTKHDFDGTEQFGNVGLLDVANPSASANRRMPKKKAPLSASEYASLKAYLDCLVIVAPEAGSGGNHR